MIRQYFIITFRVDPAIVHGNQIAKYHYIEISLAASLK